MRDGATSTRDVVDWLIGRCTWLYFDTFVTAEHNHLPPDNFQETPEPVVAARTSPTNIGVYLLSVVSARDFGWIGLDDTLARFEATLATLERLEKHRGHLLNWYDTRTLAPLSPRYVSSVDSGNLAGHLVTLASVCKHWAEAPSVHLDAGVDGLHDVVAVLAEELASLPDDRRALRPLRERLVERLAGFSSATRTHVEQSGVNPVRLINLQLLIGDIRKLAVELDDEIGSPASLAVLDWSVRLDDNCGARLDLVHRLGWLAVPRCARGRAWHPPLRQSAVRAPDAAQ